MPELYTIVNVCVCCNVTEQSALDYVAGYSIGLDMTLRDNQVEMKDKRLPWTSAKAFDTSLALGGFIERSRIDIQEGVEVWLTVNGEEKQRDSTSLMIFPVGRLISDASRMMTLEAGDIVATGTPKGVGQVSDGDVLRAGINGFEDFDVQFSCRGL